MDTPYAIKWSALLLMFVFATYMGGVGIVDSIAGVVGALLCVYKLGKI